MDLTTTTVPKSDQQNFDDYIGGPKTVTITEVREGSDEQPVAIHLAEFPGRPYKPSKTMRRVLVAAWGADTDTYAGHLMTLYGDPDVKFGGVKVGGIKISHLTHIDHQLHLSLTETKGKRAPHTVDPLPDVATCTDRDALRAMYRTSGPDLRALITARVADLKAADGGAA